MGLLPFRPESSTGKPSAVNSSKPKGRRSSLKNRLVLFGLMAALFLFAIGCSKEGQSTWEAFGPVAQKQLDLFNVLLWVMVAVFIIVEGVLLYALFAIVDAWREKPPQIHGNTSLESY
ncbi:MAG: hypothetical protein Ct9H300mP11_02330 [Chloroflexota bacterium]|nr:MAG: hypothetical protein Ct9H300mP11_02330 [Chloroflexota bacterium]